MPTAVWTTSAMDVGFTGDTVLPFRDIVIPAGATLKRFLVNGTDVTAKHSGNDHVEIQQLNMHMSVDIISGEYSPRRIYTTDRRIPQNVVALYDNLTIDRVYTQWCSAGDNELGINERTSYGTAGGPGFTVRLTCHIVAHPAIFGYPTNGRAIIAFRTLHLI